MRGYGTVRPWSKGHAGPDGCPPPRWLLHGTDLTEEDVAREGILADPVQAA